MKHNTEHANIGDHRIKKITHLEIWYEVIFPKQVNRRIPRKLKKRIRKLAMKKLCDYEKVVFFG